jgi:hypothetical protein
MDKNLIKEHLRKTLVSEADTPGISVTEKAKKESGKINKQGLKDYAKGVEKDAKKENKEMSNNKINYTDKFQKTYHDEMEIMNGQEMLQYDMKPSEGFKKKAKEGIEGSSKMGNEGGVGNAEAAWGASSDNFGKDFVKRVKSSTEKRSKETPTLNLRGRDIQADMKDTGHKPYAIEENQSKAAVVADKKAIEKKKADFVPDEDYEKASREVEYGINTDSQDNNKDNNKKIKKESMKRLKFKSAFNGLGNALNLIPESYRTDNKVFEMTDGNENYKIRWEGTLNEGKAVVLMASDNKLVNEDINRMKALFGYKSQDTLGLVKGNARIDENKTFGDMLSKMKQLINEGEDMIETEAPKAKEGNWEEQKKKASEATKHISTSKGKATTAKPTEKNWDETSGGEKMMETEAPKAKESNPDKAKKQAPEAKENISTSKGKANSTSKPAEKNWDEISGGEKMFDGVAPTPKEGHWEDNVKSQAAEAKKHVHLKESEKMSEEEELDTDDLENTNSNDDAYEKAFDSMGGEEDEETDTPETDSWSKTDDDDSSDESEPPSLDDAPIEDDPEDEIVIPKPTAKGGFTLLSSPITGIYVVKGPGLPLLGMKVPDELMSIAADKSRKASERAAIIARKLEDMEMEPEMSGEEELDEYGDEHAISTKDAVSGIKGNK